MPELDDAKAARGELMTMLKKYLDTTNVKAEISACSTALAGRG
jgi:hypothetical protein